MKVIKISFEASDRENLYFSACRLLKKQGEITDSKLAVKDIISALQKLSEAADLGDTGAISMINEIRFSLGKIRPSFIPSEDTNDQTV